MKQIVEWLKDPARVVYHPVDYGEQDYWERVDRNVGWITKDEQEILRNSVLGVAGCGGMGAFLNAIYARGGIREVRLADSDAFDLSNLNRQFSARRETIGKSKALCTAEDVRRITDDVKISAYYDGGICPKTVEHFADGCDVILDEVEFFALDARMLLHRVARERGIALFNCNTIGFGSRLFLFTPDTMSIEDMLGLSYEEAVELTQKARHSLDQSEKELARARISNLMLRGFVPEPPKYKKDDDEMLAERLKEGKAPIIFSNPPMASGFLADRVLLHLLRNSGEERDIVQVPPPPGYLYFDAAKMVSKAVERKTIW